MLNKPPALNMSAQNQTNKKYNVVISKLFQIVLDLTEEQQLLLLRHAEDLFAKEKRLNIRKSCDIPVNYATDYRVYTNHIKNISRSGRDDKYNRLGLFFDETNIRLYRERI